MATTDPNRTWSLNLISVSGLSRTHRRLILTLAGVAALLVSVYAVHVALGEPSWEIDRAFNLDGEGNLPTWFSSLLSTFGALAAYACSQAAASPRERRVWQLLAGALLFMSCDETAQLHEHVAKELLLAGVCWPGLSRNDIWLWPLTLGPFVLLGFGWLAAGLHRALRGSRSARRRILGGLALFFLGSVGVELTNILIHGDTPLHVWPTLEVIAEESLEMAGLIMLLSGLLLHLQVLQDQMRGSRIERQRRSLMQVVESLGA